MGNAGVTTLLAIFSLLTRIATIATSDGIFHTERLFDERQENKGFGIRPFGGKDLLILHCNGGGLPASVKDLYLINLEKTVRGSTQPKVICQLKKGDGVKLERVDNNAEVFVTGHFDTDDVRASSLSVILPFSHIQEGVKYGCRIAAIPKSGIPEVKYRELELDKDTINALRPTPPPAPSPSTVPPATAQTPARSRSASDDITAEFNIFSGEWTMVKTLLVSLVSMVLILTIACTILLAVRCRGHQQNFTPRPWSPKNPWECGDHLGPLPPVPGGSGNPYNTMRSHKSLRSMHCDEDTYASVRYIPPWDEPSTFKDGKP